MRVFLTGASGFIGSAVIPELIDAGHEVLGLARSDAAAATVAASGAAVHRGSLEDLDSLRRGADGVDAVIHAGFIHEFDKFAENSAIDRQAILAMGEVLAGSDRPLIVTSGTGFTTSGRPRTEDDPPIPSSARMPRASEEAASAVQAQGVRTMIVRLPQVHDRFKQGIITYMVAAARERGVSPYVGDGLNRLAAVPLPAAAQLYRLVLEKGEPGARYQAIAEEGVPTRAIAEALGRGLNVPVVSMSPEEAFEHFGWLGAFLGADLSASSTLTRQRLGWEPTGDGLIADLDRMDYGNP